MPVPDPRLAREQQPPGARRRRAVARPTRRRPAASTRAARSSSRARATSRSRCWSVKEGGNVAACHFPLTDEEIAAARARPPPRSVAPRTASPPSDAVRSSPQGTRTAQDAADAIGCEVGQIVKSLVFRRAASGPAARGHQRRQPRRRARARWSAPPSRPTPPSSASAPASRSAACRPSAGPAPRRSSTLVDEDLLAHDEVWAAAGTPTEVFPLTPAELVGARAGASSVSAPDPRCLGNASPAPARGVASVAPQRSTTGGRQCRPGTSRNAPPAGAPSTAAVAILGLARARPGERRPRQPGRPAGHQGRGHRQRRVAPGRPGDRRRRLQRPGQRAGARAGRATGADASTTRAFTGGDRRRRRRACGPRRTSSRSSRRYAKGNEGQLSRDGRSALVTFEHPRRRGRRQGPRRRRSSTRPPRLDQRATRGLRIEQFGDASADKALSQGLRGRLQARPSSSRCRSRCSS